MQLHAAHQDQVQEPLRLDIAQIDFLRVLLDESEIVLPVESVNVMTIATVSVGSLPAVLEPTVRAAGMRVTNRGYRSCGDLRPGILQARVSCSQGQWRVTSGRWQVRTFSPPVARNSGKWRLATAGRKGHGSQFPT